VGSARDLSDVGDLLLCEGLTAVGRLCHPDTAVWQRRTESALELEERDVNVAVRRDGREGLLDQAAGDRFVDHVPAV
jgi:hypothetical protein